MDVLPSRKSVAYRHIQAAIVSGQMAPGESISEVSLAREIGISRTPVREAIGQLLAEGLLRQVPGRGTVVTRPTRADLVELYELREALEVYAVRKVAQQPPQQDEMQRLEELCQAVSTLARELEESGERRLPPAAMESFLAHDLQFHMLLLRAAGNHHILKVVRNTRLMIRIFHAQLPGHDVAQLRDIAESHRGILEAIQRGDAAAAAEQCGRHIRRSCQERLGVHDHWERMARIPSDDAFLQGLG